MPLTVKSKLPTGKKQCNCTQIKALIQMQLNKSKKINEAYETLKDPCKRKEYDLKNQPQQQPTFHRKNFDDFFQNFQSNIFTTRRNNVCDSDSDDSGEGVELNTIFECSLPKNTNNDDFIICIF